MKAFKPAIELVDCERMQVQIQQAKEVALKELQKDEPKLTMEQIVPANYEQYLKPLPRTTASSGSTRGGIATLLATLQQEKFSSLSILYDELGMSLKSGNTTSEVMQLLTESFDLGMSEAPEFKNVEVKESTVEGMYTNMLAHSSPRIIFATEQVRDMLSMLYSTSLARRSFFFFPSQDETVENNSVPETIEASRALSESRRATIVTKVPAISDAMTKSIDRLLRADENRLVTFTPDAASLYSDYFDYCTKRSEIMEDSSILQIEMAGRSFKLGKLAAIWALAGGSSVITKEIYSSAIYLAEYSAQYLAKFVKLTTSKPYQLLADVFTSGKQTHITLDAALTNGYISRITPTFAELIDPLNSVLRKDGICSYNEDTKTFVYQPFTKVVAPAPDQSNCSFAMSYKMVPDMSKDARSQHLNEFTAYRDKLCYTNLINIVTRDTIYNPFEYKEVDNIPHNRAQANIISTTNLVVLDIDKSTVPMDTISEFMENYQHLVATTSDKTNRNKFRILIPINVELDGANTKQFSFVVKRIAADLLVDADLVSFNPSQPYYGYAGAEIILHEDGALFDVTPYLNEFAADEETVVARKLVKKRSKPAQRAHTDKILDNISKNLDFAITAKHGEGSLMLARAALWLVDEGLSASELTTAIEYVNSCWEVPMNIERLQNTIILPYSAKCSS